MSEVIKSFLRRINETTPFIASYIIAFLFIHSREIVIIFTEASIDKKLSLLSWNNFNPWYPLLFAFAYVLFYPILNMFLKYITLWYQVTTKRLLEKINQKTVIEELSNKLENVKKSYTKDIEQNVQKYEASIKELMHKLNNNDKDESGQFLKETIDNLSQKMKLLELNIAFIQCASRLIHLNEDKNEKLKKFIVLPVSLKLEALSLMNTETKQEFSHLFKASIEYDNIENVDKVWKLLEYNHIAYSTTFNFAKEQKIAENWVDVLKEIRECYDKRRYQ